MAKKKKTQAANELIDSLMEDLKDIVVSEETAIGADPTSLFNTDDSIAEQTDGEAVGLAPDDFRVMEDPEGFTVWKNGESSTPASGDSAYDAQKDESFSASNVLKVVQNESPHLFESSDSESSFNSAFSIQPGGLPNLEKAVGTEPATGNLKLDLGSIPSADEDNIFGQSESFDPPAFSTPDSVGFNGPSADDGFQSIDDIFGGPSSKPAYPQLNSSEEEKTRPIGFDPEKTRPVGFGDDPNSKASQFTDPDRTLAAEGFAAARPGRRSPLDEKVGIGSLKSAGAGKPGSTLTFADASLVQAENLKIAQNRILELEKEVERLRGENEELASAAEIIKTRSDEYHSRLGKVEKEKQEIEDSHRAELLVLKGNLQFKETEVAKARLKVEELETRLKNDFKKIRVKERELENRLELARAEKAALLRSKDEYILDLKRKIDQLQSELDNYRSKVLELNKTLDGNQEQFKRTVRALRLALTNLELKDGEQFPLKKAE